MGTRVETMPGVAADATRVTVMTVVRDEPDMLPRWLSYYGGQLGYESLLVVDDGTIDGSTDDLPCPCYRLPPGPWKAGWGRTRARLANGLASGLLAVNDAVIFTDVDELLVPDPARHAGLREYLGARADRGVVAPVAVELVHHVGIEPVLDADRLVLEQRGFVKYSPAMCKPLVRRGGARWSHGFHGSTEPFEVDPELWMFHLKFADETLLRKTARARQQIHREEGRGHPDSFWPMSEDLLTARLEEWTRAGVDVPDFDTADIDLSGLVRADESGIWKATAHQVKSLDRTPLRRVPARFRSAF